MNVKASPGCNPVARCNAGESQTASPCHAGRLPTPDWPDRDRPTSPGVTLIARSGSSPISVKRPPFALDPGRASLPQLAVNSTTGLIACNAGNRASLG